MALTPRQLAQRVAQLTSLPEINFQLQAMIDDPNASITDMGRMVATDPALTARLLRVANSAMYGFVSRVDNVNRAITLIGTEQLRYLVLAASTIDAFARIAPEQININTFWQHSVACAVYSQLLARRCRLLQTERLFVAGMLHDVGQLVIFAEIPEQTRQVLLTAGTTETDLFQAEQAVLGFTHAEVGAELMRAWNLPRMLQMTAAFHYTPDLAPEFEKEVAIVSLANVLANQSEPARYIDGDMPPPVFHPAALEITGLVEEELPDTITAGSEILATYMEVFCRSGGVTA